MDWQSVATELVEHCERPMAVIDASGQICLANRLLTQLLGMRRGELAERANKNLFSAGRALRGGERTVDAALRGEPGRLEFMARRSDGKKVALLLGFSPVTQSGGGAVVTVLAAAPNPLADAPQIPEGLTYEVSAGAAGFGTLRMLEAPDARLTTRAAAGGRCFRVIFGRETPCPGCPALALENAPGTKRHISVLPPAATGPLRVVTADRVDATTIRLLVTSITEPVLSGLIQAKIDRLALRAALSKRERDVLQLLLLGRSLREIGAVLGIRVRTVRFHQGNLLEKLGADSRADLMRLFL